MKEENKYAHLNAKSLIDLLNKKYAQLALITNNKFNLERKALELNEDISLLRQQINRQNTKTGEKND